MNDNKLHILWTNADPLSSEHMVMMYAKNAMLQKWWDEITVIIWGATSKLVAEDMNMQKLIKEAQEAGVKFSACISCANNLGTKDKIEKLGIELIVWGVPLTKVLKDKSPIIYV